jgi:cytochrome d ubiquinol oxidase subunit I
MEQVALARWHFAITSIYHYFFVPLTLGLSILVALFETAYVRTGDDTYKKMTKFWGKLFLINFAMGVVTGIVMEFQFGMNWSEYSRFVGDIFGAPLAIEALMAFFLESTFLGIWIFGWNVLPKGLHAGVMWLVAIGSNLSALWILIANSFMQEPVGYVLNNGRAEMVDFGALLSNPHVWVQFPHVFASGLVTAAFFIAGISAYNLYRKRGDQTLFARSLSYGLVVGLIAGTLVGLVGHSQAQHMVRTQPMKMAAAEGLWTSEDPASMSLFTIGDEERLEDVWSIRVPGLLSFLAFNRLEGEVQGIRDIQAEYELIYGPGDYVPPLPMSYWSFRGMVGAGVLMVGLAAYGMYLIVRDKVRKPSWFLKWLPLAIGLPYLANSTGWLFTEIGRQPWIVFGLLRTDEGISPNVPVGTLIFSLVAFTLIYAVLIAVDVFLLARYARPEAPSTTSEA